MARLGDCFCVIRNGASIKQMDDSGGLPITRIETISNREVDRSKLGYAGIKDAQKYQDYLLQDCVILMSHINSTKHLGKVAIYRKKENEQIIHGMNLLMLRANQSVNCPQYAFYYFDSDDFKRQILRITKNSVNQASFTVTALKELKIPLPTLGEQRKIAAVLDKISDLIVKRRRQLDKLDELVKSRFVEMFGLPDKNPYGWYQSVLGDYVKVVGGYAFKSSGFLDSGIPVLRIGNINTGHFSCTNMVYWQEDPALERYKVYPNDLVMSLTGTVDKDDYGNVCMLGNEYPMYYLNQRNAKLEIQKFLNKCYLSELLKFPYMKKQLTKVSRGVRQANISNNDILNLCITVPPIALQEQFAIFIGTVEELKSKIINSLVTLETLKKSLMQEYFLMR